MKNITSLCIITSLVFFLACKTNNKTSFSSEEIAKESEKVNAFFKNKFKENLDMHPMNQTYLGIKKDADKWDDISEEFEAKELAKTKEALQWMKDSVSVEALDKDTKLSYKLFKQLLENTIEDATYSNYEYPVNQMHGMQAEIPAFLINMHQIEEVKDAEAYISRLNNLKKMFEQLTTKLKANEAKGILIPKFVFAKVLEDSRNIIKGQPFDTSTKKSTLLNDFEEKVNKLSISAQEKATLINNAKKALKTSVKEAYSNLITTLETQEKNATTDDGAWKFPNGEAFYNNALKRTTTTNLTAQEIHDIGLKEVARNHDEMRVIMKKVGVRYIAL